MACTTVLYRPRSPDLPHTAQPIYNLVFDCTYWPVLGTYNNWNITNFKNNCTSSEDFDKINRVVLDGIIDNMKLLVNTGKYNTINKTDIRAMVY